MKKVILLTLVMPYLASAQPIATTGQGTVIISEIMADPAPAVGLPLREYIELFNSNDFAVSLGGWKYISGESSVTLPEIDIGPSEYLILVHENYRGEFAPFGKCAGLKQFPVLNDAGKLLLLLDASGRLIHGVEYSASWYRDKLRSEGGWSLEIIDRSQPFSGASNWKASRSSNGGTPGSVNSVDGVNRDESFGGLINVFPVDPLHLLVAFSEPVLLLAENPGQINVNGTPIEALINKDPLFRSFFVTLATPLKEGIGYKLTIDNMVADFAGNQARRKEFMFGLPMPPSKGDMLFNELLFNPVGDGYDYIEFVNVSSGILDASCLYVVSVNEAGDTSGVYSISSEGRCIMQGSYYAITCGKQSVTDRYASCDPDYLFEVPSLPSMNNDEGHLLLMTRRFDIIDEVRYSDDMHFSLLSNHEGIALEKTGPGNFSLDPASWHSASGSAGWGTPGKRNSVFAEVPVVKAAVTLSSTRISPDNDGFEDFLSIHISFPTPGNVASVTIFDETGFPVKDVAANLLAGTESDILWDGTASDGTLVPGGIYVILITSYNDKGQVFRSKKACSVIR